MKQIFSLLCLLAIFSINSFAQINPSAGYSHSPWTSRQYTTIKSAPYAVVLNGFDTLKSASSSDTGFMQFSFPNKYNMVYDLNVTSLTGTLAATAVLMGSNSSTMPSATSSSWKILTCDTVTCTSCVKQTATISGSGTTQYEYHIPYEKNDYQYWQLRIISTGTCTATYTSLCGYKN